MVDEASAPQEREELLAAARRGDAEAFGELCRAYEDRLVRQAMSLCGNLDLAEDLAQDTLVEAWKSLHRFNERCRFFTWLCAILLNQYRNARRKKRPLPFSAFSVHAGAELQSHLANVPTQEPRPDQLSLERERALQIRTCIEALPLKQQQVLHLRFYVDDSLEAIAAALGCSVGTVKSRLFTALEKLRKMRTLNTGQSLKTMYETMPEE